MIVWLWDANGPATDGSGITDDEALARRAAEDYMLATKACTARVESAYTNIGLNTLTAGYRRTGKGWVAEKRRDGRVAWATLSWRELAAP